MIGRYGTMYYVVLVFVPNDRPLWHYVCCRVGICMDVVQCNVMGAVVLVFA